MPMPMPLPMFHSLSLFILHCVDAHALVQLRIHSSLLIPSLLAIFQPSVSASVLHPSSDGLSEKSYGPSAGLMLAMSHPPVRFDWSSHRCALRKGIGAAAACVLLVWWQLDIAGHRKSGWSGCIKVMICQQVFSILALAIFLPKFTIKRLINMSNSFFCFRVEIPLLELRSLMPSQLNVCRSHCNGCIKVGLRRGCVPNTFDFLLLDIHFVLGKLHPRCHSAIVICRKIFSIEELAVCKCYSVCVNFSV